MSDLPPATPQAPGLDRSKSQEDRESLADYAAAMRSIRAARGVFVLLLVLSLLIHIGAYAASKWGRVLAIQESSATDIAAPADEAAAPPVELVEKVAPWKYVLEIALPLASFVGMISCGLLVFTFFLAANVCLSGRLGGVGGSVSSFFWMLLLLALLFPWDRGLEGVQIPGVYYTFAELESVVKPVETSLSSVQQLWHYARYLGYPLLALIIGFMADRRFSLAYRDVEKHLQAKLGGP